MLVLAAGPEMPAEVLRFGVRDGAHRRAATWKLWTEGTSEVYVACRALGGELKASLHESGKWHLAVSRETFDADVRETIRPKEGSLPHDECAPPLEIGPGMRLAVRIITPWSSARLPIDHSERRVRWVPCAPEGHATEVDVVFTSPGIRVVGWPGARSMRTSLIGSLVMQSGESVWAVHRIIAFAPQPAMPPGPGRLLSGRSKADPTGDTLRTLSFGTEADGSRVIYECAVDIDQSGT